MEHKIKLKNTPVRNAILKIFKEASVPLDAEMVFKKISKIKDLKGTNEATIYRNLTTLEQGKVLRKIDLRKDSIHFELADLHHHHIVCTSCEKVEDFENKEIEKILSKVTKKSEKFTKVTDHSLELFGVCRECA